MKEKVNHSLYEVFNYFRYIAKGIATSYWKSEKPV